MKTVTLILAAGLAVPVAAAHSQQSPAERARADNGHPHYMAADLRFMSGMIGHEINMLQRWLRDRFRPALDSWHSLRRCTLTS